MKSLLLENPDVGLQGIPNLNTLIEHAKTTFHFESLVPGAYVAIIDGDPVACLLARCAGLDFRDTILINTTGRTVFVPLFQKPVEGTIVENILRFGVGALNLKSVKFPINSLAWSPKIMKRPPRTANKIYGGGKGTNLTEYKGSADGRWPANLIMVHDASCRPDTCAPKCAVQLLREQLASPLEEDRFYMVAGSLEEALSFVRKLIG